METAEFCKVLSVCMKQPELSVCKELPVCKELSVCKELPVCRVLSASM